MKPWYKSKTIIFNLIVAILIAIEASFTLFQDVLPATVYAVLATILAIGNAILRVLSNTSILGSPTISESPTETTAP
jgi:hypothetical protein